MKYEFDLTPEGTRIVSVDYPYDDEHIGIVRQVKLYSGCGLEASDGYGTIGLGFFRGDVIEVSEYLMGLNLLDIDFTEVQKFNK